MIELSAFQEKKKKISVIGLGYVGLPLALILARKYSVIGYDINEERIKMMKKREDPSQEMDASEFDNRDIIFTSESKELSAAHFHIVTVPTPVNDSKVPNLSPLVSASEIIGDNLKKGDYVIYESTVYPGCTEECCIPILESKSGLTLGQDFKVGYSPERINPGDKKKTITDILKIVSGNDKEALSFISEIYNSVITAGVYEAPSIKIAEAAKVIENTQRDLNISFMNELAIIFDLMKIDTSEVLKAASTKWNFLNFYPGLVGGHCIGVDPYYLVHKSKQLGYDPQVILSGRRVNDEMPRFIAKKLVQFITAKDISPSRAKILVKGITFKENVSDIRNSKVVDLVSELMKYSINVHISDPHASANDLVKQSGFSLVDQISDNYDAVIVAVAHDDYKELDMNYFRSIMNDAPILFDIKGLYNEAEDDIEYWRL